MSGAEQLFEMPETVSADDVVGRQLHLWCAECRSSGRLELGVLTDEELAAIDMEPVPQTAPFPMLAGMEVRELSSRIDSARRMLRARGLDFDGDPGATLDPALGALLRIRCDADVVALGERATAIGTDWCIFHVLSSSPVGLVEEVSGEGMHAFRLERRDALLAGMAEWLAPDCGSAETSWESIDFTVERSDLHADDDALSPLSGARSASAVHNMKGDDSQGFSVFTSDHFLVVGSDDEGRRAVRYRSVDHAGLMRYCADVIGD